MYINKNTYGRLKKCLLCLQMQNTSSLSIEYSIRLESLSLLRHAHAQEIPPFLDKKAKRKTLVGRFVYIKALPVNSICGEGADYSDTPMPKRFHPSSTRKPNAKVLLVGWFSFVAVPVKSPVWWGRGWGNRLKNSVTGWKVFNY